MCGYTIQTDDKESYSRNRTESKLHTELRLNISRKVTRDKNENNKKKKKNRRTKKKSAIM